MSVAFDWGPTGRPSSAAKRAAMKRHAIKVRDGNRCFWCEQEKATTVDHLQPKSGGGTNDTDNLVGCCFTCNNLKANKDPFHFATKLLPKRMGRPMSSAWWGRLIHRVDKLRPKLAKRLRAHRRGLFPDSKNTATGTRNMAPPHQRTPHPVPGSELPPSPQHDSHADADEQECQPDAQGNPGDARKR